MKKEVKTFTFKVEVMLRNEVLDPQGEVIKQTIKNNGLNNILNVKQGKIFEVKISSTDLEEAKKDIERACIDILANPVIEKYKILEA